MSTISGCQFNDILTPSVIRMDIRPRYNIQFTGGGAVVRETSFSPSFISTILSRHEYFKTPPVRPMHILLAIHSLRVRISNFHT